MPYCGVIEEIWELNYVKFIVCLSKCKWVDSNISVQTDDFIFTLVDLKKLAYQNESFIMVEQAKQVFYVQDPCDERLILIRELIQIYQCNSKIISSDTDIAINPLTLENTNNEFDIIKLPDFFNDSKVRHGS